MDGDLFTTKEDHSAQRPRTAYLANPLESKEKPGRQRCRGGKGEGETRKRNRERKKKSKIKPKKVEKGNQGNQYRSSIKSIQEPPSL